MIKNFSNTFFYYWIIFPLYFRKIKSFIFLGTYRIAIGKNVRLNFYGFKTKKFGRGINLYDNSVIELHGDANIELGCNVVVSYGAIISCSNLIKIGDRTQIGEYTTIRDTTHDYKQNIRIHGKPDIKGEITIGKDVWIGRGCIIMPNTIINDNAIIGANSLVKGIVEANAIVAGVPAKFLRYRD